MRPVTVKGLVDVFRSNGISLHRERSCSSPPTLAEATNLWNDTAPEHEAIRQREGDVLCSIEPTSVGHIVRRVHYQGDEETYVDTLNVDCSVYPSDSAHAATQIGRVERALHVVLRRFGGRAGPTSERVAIRLAREFREKLGIDLTIVLPNRTLRSRLPLRLEPSAQAQRRFGRFEIVIYDTSREPKLQVYGKHPDPSGIYWIRVTTGWTAETLYGRVLLRWWNMRRDVTTGWRRLDGVLRTAASVRDR